MLCLENISWTAPDGKTLLRDVDLTVPEGKLVVITGPNGSGKTTLARLIAGIETPTTGRILMDGRDITEMNLTERARNGISFGFQQPVRFKGITVRQLLEIAVGSKLDDESFCDILSKVGLCSRGYLDREVNSTLSGGEIKRIEIATVFARHTRFSVFDEPEAGIDLWSFKNLIDVFKKMHDDLEGTLIIISHQERILRIADELVLLVNGTIQAHGSGDELLTKVLATEGVSVCCMKKAVLDE